jgi:hypothetical protein
VVSIMRRLLLVAEHRTSMAARIQRASVEQEAVIGDTTNGPGPAPGNGGGA